MSIQGTVHRHAFNAMGSLVEVVLVGGNQAEATIAFDRAAALADEWERTFSRFRSDSELSRLNQAGSTQRASQMLFDGVEAALAAARMTDGLFDPTLLPSLVAFGYDRPYDEIVAAGREVAARDFPDGLLRPSGWQDIVVDYARREIMLPPGVQLDLGGIAKGRYADRLASELAGWPGGVVSAGGDMRLWGTPPAGDRWVVGVEHPDDTDSDIGWLEVAAGGVATSGTNRRHWRQAGRSVHHLIDPRTGRPADSGLRMVTAVAPSAIEAEVLSTALFVAGRLQDPSGWLASRLILAVGVDADSRLQLLYQRPEGHHDGTRGAAARAA
jgi:thiamine biosynthesis lipoprotein